MGDLDSQIEVGIGKDNRGTFASQFQGDALNIVSCCLLDQFSNFGGASESHLKMEATYASACD